MDSVFEPTSLSFDTRRDGSMQESYSSFLSFSSFATLDKDTAALAPASSFSAYPAIVDINNNTTQHQPFTLDCSPTSQSTSSFVDTAYADDTVVASSDPFEIVTSAFDVDAALDFGIDFGLGGSSGLGYEFNENDFGFDCGFGADYHSVSSSQAGPSKASANNRIVDLSSGAFAYAPFGVTAASHSVGTSPPRPTTSASEYDNSPLVTPSSRDRVSFSSTSPDFPRAGFSWDDAPLTLGSSASRHRTPIADNAAPTYAATPAPLRAVSNPALSASAASSASGPRALKAVMSLPALKEEDPFQWVNIPDGPEQVSHPASASGSNYDWVFGNLGMDQASLDGTIFAAFKEGETGSDSWTDLPNLGLTAQTPKMPPVPTPTVAPPSTSHSTSSSISVPASVCASATKPVQSQLPTSFSTETQIYIPEPLSTSASMSSTTMIPAIDLDPFAFTSSNADIRPVSAPEEAIENFGMLSAPGAMIRSHTAPGMPQRAAPSDIFYQPPAPSYPSSLSVSPNEFPAPFNPQTSSFDASYTVAPTPISTSASTPSSTSQYVSQHPRSFSGRRQANPHLTVNVDTPSSFTHTTTTGSAGIPAGPASASAVPTMAYPQSATYPSHGSATLHAPTQMQRAGSQPLPMRRASTSNLHLQQQSQLQQRMASQTFTPMDSQLPGQIRSPALSRTQTSVTGHMVRAQAPEAEGQTQRVRKRIPMEQASVMQPPQPQQSQPTTPASSRSASITGWGVPGPMQQQQQHHFLHHIPPQHYAPHPAIAHHQPQQAMTYHPMPVQHAQHAQQQLQQQHQQQPFVSHPPAPVPQQPPHYQQTISYGSTQPVQHPPVHKYPYPAPGQQAGRPSHPAAQSIFTDQPLMVHPPVAGIQQPTYQPPPPHRTHPPPLSAGLPATATVAVNAVEFTHGHNPHGAAMTNTGRPMARLPSPSKARKTSSPKQRSPSGKRRANNNGGFQMSGATFINFTSDDAEKLLTGVAPSGSQNKRKREEEQARLALQQQQQQQQLQQQGQGQVPMPMPMQPAIGMEGPMDKRARVE